MRIKHLVLANGACSLSCNQSQSTNELMMCKIIFIASGPAKINLLYIYILYALPTNTETVKYKQFSPLSELFYQIFPFVLRDLYNTFPLQQNNTKGKSTAYHCTAIKSKVPCAVQHLDLPAPSSSSPTGIFVMMPQLILLYQWVDWHARSYQISVSHFRF